MNRDIPRTRLKALTLALLVLSLAGTLAVDADTSNPPFNPHVADVEVRPDVVAFDPAVENDGIVLTVSSERDLLIERFFKRGETPYFEPLDVHGKPVGDCTFTWQLTALPVVDPSVQEILKAARAKGDSSIIWELRDEGLLPPGPLVQTGYVTTERGRFIDPNEQEGGPKKQGAEGGARDMASSGLGFVAGEAGLDNVSAADQVINDDLIVTRSICVGFDCVNGEVFGFDTIRLKENNLRIRFFDTSVGSFPTRDWQLTANDSASGGASKFSIDDIDGGRTPFTVEANSPSHSLYVDDGGRIGFGTSTPVVELHVKDGDTPTLRLEQDGSSGFAPQTWDVAGNETSFFIRDATNGSTLPLRIRPGAGSNRLVIDSDSDVGVGTLSPEATLHVHGTNGSTQLLVREASGAVADRVMALLENNGNTRFRLDNQNEAGSWSFVHRDNGTFNVNRDGSGINAITIDTASNVTIAQNLTVNGTFSNPSSRALKTNFETVDPAEVLARVNALSLPEWSYTADEGGVRHLGPIAEEFWAAFGLGIDDKHISPNDTAGVALAAIQGLNAKLEAEIAELRALVEQLSQKENE